MLTLAEVAARLGVKSEKTVVRLITAGELAAFRIGGRYKVAETDLRAYLDRARVTVTK